MPESAKIQFTPAQSAAITARGGSLLVSAAAGSGKTRGLVERVVGLITDPIHPVEADSLLIMTFTNAAAAKLRADITTRLAEEVRTHPGDMRLRRQQLLLQRAAIGTVDAFCLHFVQQHFAALDVPPDFTTAEEAELARIEQETLSAVLESAYTDADFRAFADLYDRGRTDSTAGDAVLDLYHFTRALPHPAASLAAFAAMWQQDAPPKDTLWGKELLGIALAMFRRVDADKRANYKSMFISTALAVFLTGVTEPLEFMFMFCAMPLYIVYALLQGCAFAMAGIIHLRLHSFGNLEFITRIPMSLQAGLGGDIINFVICVIAFFVIGYFVAYFMIGKLQLATPGRLGNYTDDNADDSAAAAKTEKKADKKADNGQAERIIALLGGRENIVLVDACMTRLRVTVKDPAKVADLAAWKAEGALSLLVKGDGIQAVYGPKADVLKSDINDIL